MDDRILDEQRALLALVRDEDWDVTDVELSVYDSPWEEDVPEATITITARKPFPDAADDDENPYRIDD